MSEATGKSGARVFNHSLRSWYLRHPLENYLLCMYNSLNIQAPVQVCFQTQLALRDSFRTNNLPEQPEANTLIQLNKGYFHYFYIRIISANILWSAIVESSLIKRNVSSCNRPSPYHNVNMCSHTNKK